MSQPFPGLLLYDLFSFKKCCDREMKPVSGFLFSSLAASFLPGGANPITCPGQIFPFFLKI
jgi:hypothetical protein